MKLATRITQSSMVLKKWSVGRSSHQRGLLILMVRSHNRVDKGLFIGRRATSKARGSDQTRVCKEYRRRARIAMINLQTPSRHNLWKQNTNQMFFCVLFFQRYDADKVAGNHTLPKIRPIVFVGQTSAPTLHNSHIVNGTSLVVA